MSDIDAQDAPSEDEAPDGGEDFEGPASRRRWALIAAAAVVVVGLGVGLGVGLSSSPAAPVGPEGVVLQQVPDLASANSTASGQPVDGITCRTAAEQVVKYHIHIHVDIFVNGQQERIPAGAGIPTPRLAEHFASGLFYDNGISNCLYWLHVHTNDGIIHVEAPYKHTFTLGQFFDVWGQPLGPDQVGPAHGTVTAFVNGQRFNGLPQNLPLINLADLQLDVGTPVVAFQPLHFRVSGLCGEGTSTCRGELRNPKP